MVRVAIDDFITITTIRASWSERLFCEGSSRWNFLTPRAAGDVRELVADRWLEFLAPSFIAGRSTSWRLDTLQAIDLWPGDQAALVLDVRLDADPPGDGPGLPAQISPLISWRTGEIGRANRGRTYLGQYTVESVESSNVVSPAIDAAHDFGQAMEDHFMGTVTVGEPQFIIVSHQEDGVPIVPGAYSPVTDWILWDRWATVRLRNGFTFSS